MFKAALWIILGLMSLFSLTKPTYSLSIIQEEQDGENKPCGPPKVETFPRVTVNEGQMVSLTCPLNANVSCLVDMVVWYRSENENGDGRKRIHPADENLQVYPFDPLTMYILKPRPSNQGWYTCMVRNRRGVARATTYLTVTAANPRTDSHGDNSAKEHMVSFDSEHIENESNRSIMEDSHLRFKEDSEGQSMKADRFPKVGNSLNIEAKKGRSNFNHLHRLTASAPTIKHPAIQEASLTSYVTPLTSDLKDHVERINEHVRYIFDWMKHVDDRLAALES